MLALGAIGVVAGVRLLGLRSRGLALGLASVGILMWLGILSIVLEGPHRRPWWPGSAYEMSISSSLAIYVLGVAGYDFVILTLHRWRNRFDNAKDRARPGSPPPSRHTGISSGTLFLVRVDVCRGKPRTNGHKQLVGDSCSGNRLSGDCAPSKAFGIYRSDSRVEDVLVSYFGQQALYRGIYECIRPVQNVNSQGILVKRLASRRILFDAHLLHPSATSQRVWRLGNTSNGNLPSEGQHAHWNRPLNYECLRYWLRRQAFSARC